MVSDIFGGGMNKLPHLYDNASLYCYEWRNALARREAALVNIFEQMAEYNRQRIAEVKATTKAGGKK